MNMLMKIFLMNAEMADKINEIYKSLPTKLKKR